MKKFIFDLITSPLSLFGNPIYNYIAMAIIGIVAFKIAFEMVGELGLSGELGSIVHWLIRLLVFALVWFICCVVISLIEFIINNWITIMISAILLLIVYSLNIHAENTPTSILNRRIF